MTHDSLTPLNATNTDVAPRRDDHLHPPEYNPIATALQQRSGHALARHNLWAGLPVICPRGAVSTPLGDHSGDNQLKLYHVVSTRVVGGNETPRCRAGKSALNGVNWWTWHGCGGVLRGISTTVPTVTSSIIITTRPHAEAAGTGSCSASKQPLCRGSWRNIGQPAPTPSPAVSA